MNDKIGLDPPPPIGTQIRRLRKQRGLTLTELAERVGTSAPAVHRYESGWDRYQLPTLKKIATALGVTLEMRLVEVHGCETGPEHTEDDLVRLISPSFWDKKLEASDLEEYPEWVLSRVLMFGMTDQVSALRCFFGDDAIRGVIKNRSIDARTRNYWELILG
jgi:transcriptional regulator with XRE-family HTH domain